MMATGNKIDEPLFTLSDDPELDAKLFDLLGTTTNKNLEDGKQTREPSENINHEATTTKLEDSVRKQEEAAKKQEEDSETSATKKEDPLWKQEKEKCLNASLEERRKKTKCTEFTSIETWPEYYNKNINKGNKYVEAEFPEISKKVSICKEDITSLLVDIIVNSALENFIGNKGKVDREIHRAAGPFLQRECSTFKYVSAGETVITAGYDLPAKYVIHAVGPQGENPGKLRDCYLSSLQYLIFENQRTIAFPCISTGQSGYPNDRAADVVLKTVREWLEKYHEKVDRVIFCLFLEKDINCYEETLQKYFPMKRGYTYNEGATARMKEDPTWKRVKENCLNATLKERKKRKKDTVPIDSIKTWPKYYNKEIKTGYTFNDVEAELPQISKKVSIWKGDITSLLVDIIVNATNENLIGGGGGGVDKAIHEAAGPLLKEECRTFGGASAGESVITGDRESVITGGYNLPAKYVVHVVGHWTKDPDILRRCYLSSLQHLIDEKQRTIAFPCIPTHFYNENRNECVEVVMKTVQGWLEENHKEVDRVIFCMYHDRDIKIYGENLREYFHMKGDNKEYKHHQDYGTPTTNRWDQGWKQEKEYKHDQDYGTPTTNRWDQGWKEEKEKCLNASLEERRKKTKCTEFTSIETWPEYYNKNINTGNKHAGAEFPEISKKVSIWKGDITTLLIDIVVNAANESLMGGGGVDRAIHDAAGPLLKEECRTFGGASVGDSKITGGYKLPAKYVVHTVGPRGEKSDILKGCYLSSLQYLIDDNQRSIAFPCISTGIFGYPNDRAAEVVLKTVREWLEKNHAKVDRVIFCLYFEKDVTYYEEYLQKYFPMKGDHTEYKHDQDYGTPTTNRWDQGWKEEKEEKKENNLSSSEDEGKSADDNSVMETGNQINEQQPMFTDDPELDAKLLDLLGTTTNENLDDNEQSNQK